MERHIISRVFPLLCLVLSGSMAAYLGCAGRVPTLLPPEPKNEPLVRVAVIEDMEQISFSCTSGFRVVDEQGHILLSIDSPGERWSTRVKFGQPAEMVYRLVLFEEKDKEMAGQRAETLRELELQPRVVVAGQELRLGNRLLNDNREYWVTIGPYATEEEASSPVSILPQGTVRRIIPEISRPPLGAVDLMDTSGRVVFSSGEPFIVVPKDLHGGHFTFYGVPVGRGFSWERQEDRSYRGRFEFRLGNDGRLLAINELSIEEYLKGVLPKEMNPGFPPAALRAQAIAARSYTIARWGIQHRLDPFDLCAEVHCQAYAGLGREHSLTNQIVDQTRGQVIVFDGQVCEAFYSAVCGGHTESSANVWGGPVVDYLMGRLDASGDQAASLPHQLSSDEKALRTWVTTTPPVYCNHLSEDAPTALHYTRKHFRWSFTYSRQELEQILREKVDAEIGHLLDLIPISRGSSGRILELQVLGDAGQLTLSRELNIRRALSPSYLPSACFVIDREMGPEGFPSAFIFWGAGWGHGVGMCQSGAAGMAVRGMDHMEILSHYYRGAVVDQIYGAAF